LAGTHRRFSIRTRSDDLKLDAEILWRAAKDVKVETDKGTIATPVVVDAAGAWTGAHARYGSTRQKCHPARLGATREADGHLGGVEIHVVADAHDRRDALSLKNG
jgi:glycine/D-amino acid oxidase-like deaminating enzyme